MTSDIKWRDKKFLTNLKKDMMFNIKWWDETFSKSKIGTLVYSKILEKANIKKILKKKIIDITCGSGELLKLAYQMNNNNTYIGVDKIEVLKYAKNKLEEAGIPVMGPITDKTAKKNIENYIGKGIILVEQDVFKTSDLENEMDVGFLTFPPTLIQKKLIFNSAKFLKRNGKMYIVNSLVFTILYLDKLPPKLIANIVKMNEDETFNWINTMTSLRIEDKLILSEGLSHNIIKLTTPNISDDYLRDKITKTYITSYHRE